jgi:hypothetical protein
MLHATNSRMGVRLALLDPERDSALVFESALSQTPQGAAGAASRSASLARAATSASLPASSAFGPEPASEAFSAGVVLPTDVNVREIPLAHTLLFSAVSNCTRARVSVRIACVCARARVPALRSVVRVCSVVGLP